MKGFLALRKRAGSDAREHHRRNQLSATGASTWSAETIAVRTTASASLRVIGLTAVGKYYAEHQAEIDAQEVFTLDFSTASETSRRYPAAKIIDIVCFQEGAKQRS